MENHGEELFRTLTGLAARLRRANDEQERKRESAGPQGALSFRSCSFVVPPKAAARPAAEGLFFMTLMPFMVEALGRYLTVKMPRSRMSLDDAPIMRRNSPGSTTHCIFASSIFS
jgi:hypothetical protein